MSLCNNGNSTYGVTGYSNSSGNGSTDGYLMNLNDNGELLGYFPFGTTQYEEPHDVEKVENGWVISGHAGTTDFRTHSVFLQFINENGSQGKYLTFGSQDHDGAESMVIFRDKIHIAARSASVDPDQDVYYVKTDMNGELLEEKWIGSEYEDPGFGLFVDAHQVLITGYSLNPVSGRKEILLLRK